MGLQLYTIVLSGETLSARARSAKRNTRSFMYTPRYVLKLSGTQINSGVGHCMMTGPTTRPNNGESELPSRIGATYPLWDQDEYY